MNHHEPTVGFAFSSKERVELTRRSLHSIDGEGGFDLIWIDGSASAEARRLPESIQLQKTRLVEVHLDVNGGPDAAIRYGLRRLLSLGYDYCGLIENDIEFVPGWFSKLMELFSLGEIDGLQVGAATTRTFSSRSLTIQPKYATLWNIGAGMVLFTREACQILLRHYHPRRAKELSQYFHKRHSDNLEHIWELWRDRSDRILGCDWGYSLELDKRGLSSLGTVPAYSYNLDLDPKKSARSDYLGGIAGIDSALDAKEIGSARAAKLTIAATPPSVPYPSGEEIVQPPAVRPRANKSLGGITFAQWLYWRLGLPLPIRFVRRVQHLLGE